MIIAIDPGKDKCGIAVLNDDGKVLEKEIVSREEIKDKTFQFILEHPSSTLVIGKSFNGNKVKEELQDLNIKICFVAEINSTLEARDLYWRENPPKGLWKIIPVSLRLPPVPIDDYAAVILGRRACGALT
jgi:RNase H-fold protein (predicted Holliday junction resolvase)